MRKLASIQRIWKIEPIEGADRIELAYVLGWQCVVNKGQFKPMDLAVYFEVDSFLPIRKEFEFLRSSSYKKTDTMGEGFRLRTMMFRKKISQGLLLPLNLFNEIPTDVTLGEDVTELLGVKKWEIEERATTGGTVIGNLPYGVPHTDETRVQACPELINEFAGLSYYISTKMDGSSHSIFLDEERKFHVCGHNYEYKNDGSSSFYKLINSIGIEDKLRKYVESAPNIKTITIQGELCAPGIQSNRLRLQNPHWYVFTIMINGERVGLYTLTHLCKVLDLECVPIEEIGDDFPSKYPDVDSVLARADGNYSTGGKKEGIVIRPLVPQYCDLINAELSMKAVSNKYLLKNE